MRWSQRILWLAFSLALVGKTSGDDVGAVDRSAVDVGEPDVRDADVTGASPDVVAQTGQKRNIEI
jgi:hypothetical protein